MSQERAKVNSSDIAEIIYDSDTQTLEVVFHATGPYRYFSVPPEVHAEFLATPTHGKYFHQNIKGKYAWERGGAESGQ